MQRSNERILTTHAGSLPRPPALLEMLLDGRRGPSFESAARRAVEEVVKRQADTGIDVVNDGEAAKTNFSTYITERLSGFESATSVRRPSVESALFPRFYDSPMGPDQVRGPIRVMTCIGQVAWRGDAQVERDVANLQGATREISVEEAFLTSASPGLAWFHQPNGYYPSHEDYIWAVADAMKHEYDAIHGAGFVVQLDCPDLAGGWNRPEFADRTAGQFRALAQMHVEALNHATRDIPPDRLRLHVCWGNFEGPHVRDIPLRSILEVLLDARPSALSFEGSNPRHAHEWELFSDVVLPEGKLLIPGVLDSTTNFVEHPELVAQRIVRYAEIVGRENVIAGADCGFATLGASSRVHPEVAWAKLGSLVDGARLASERLWRVANRSTRDDTTLVGSSTQDASPEDSPALSRGARSTTVDYGKTADDYGRHRPGFPDEFFDRLESMSVSCASQRVLDLGTGTGTLARGFALRGSRVVGLDKSVELLEIAERLDALVGVSVEYRAGDAERTELPDASVDVVSAGQCWHWFDRPQAARETRRVLVPGGALVICHLDAPHSPGSVSEATNQLIRAYNPAWDVALPGENPGSTGIYPQWTLDLAGAGFTALATFSFDVAIPYTHDAWRGKTRASGPVGATLAPEAVERLDRELADLLQTRFPEEPLQVLHRVWALVGHTPL